MYKFYQNNVGITTSKEDPIKVLLEVSLNQSEYLISQPLHMSQKEISRTNEHVVFELFVVATYELESLILGMGEDTRVLEPPLFVNRLKERISLLAKKYN